MAHRYSFVTCKLWRPWRRKVSIEHIKWNLKAVVLTIEYSFDDVECICIKQMPTRNILYHPVMALNFDSSSFSTGTGLQCPISRFDDGVSKLPNDKWRIVIASWTASCVAEATVTGWALNTPEETRGSLWHFKVALVHISLLLPVWSRRSSTLVVRAMPDAYSSDGLPLNESIGAEDDRRLQRKGASTGNQHWSVPVEGAYTKPKTSEGYQTVICTLIKLSIVHQASRFGKLVVLEMVPMSRHMQNMMIMKFQVTWW